jgi:hypothetical protein
MLNSKFSSACIFLAIFFTLSCSSVKNESTEILGEIDFNVTSNPEAQPAFNKGMLLLYSF